MAVTEPFLQAARSRHGFDDFFSVQASETSFGSFLQLRRQFEGLTLEHVKLREEFDTLS